MSASPLSEQLLISLLDEVETSDAPPPSATASPASEPTPPAATTASPTGVAPPADLLTALPGLLRIMGQPGKGGTKGHPADRHTALLRALKPYLSPTRRSAVDTLLTLAGVWDTLSDMGLRLSLPGILPTGATTAAPTPVPAVRDTSASADDPPDQPPERGGEG